MEDLFHLGIKALIMNKEGKILLLRVNPEELHGGKRDYWDIPGGRLQKDENIVDTLYREVLEETGISRLLNISHLVIVVSNIRIPVENDTVGLILSIYKCDIQEPVQIKLSKEHIEFKWFTPLEAAELLSVKYPSELQDKITQI